MEKKVIVKAKKEKINIEIPELKNKEFYWFLFNEKCPEKELINVRHLISGELAIIFIKQGYGILC